MGTWELQPFPVSSYNRSTHSSVTGLLTRDVIRHFTVCITVLQCTKKFFGTSILSYPCLFLNLRHGWLSKILAECVTNLWNVEEEEQSKGQQKLPARPNRDSSQDSGDPGGDARWDMSLISDLSSLKVYYIVWKTCRSSGEEPGLQVPQLPTPGVLPYTY